MKKKQLLATGLLVAVLAAAVVVGAGADSVVATIAAALCVAALLVAYVLVFAWMSSVQRKKLGLIVGLWLGVSIALLAAANWLLERLITS